MAIETHGRFGQACALALLLAALASPLVAKAEDRRGRLLAEARQTEAAMRSRGVVLDDPALDAYLQGIVERLYPGIESAFRVHVYRSLDSNAFALADGGIYVNLGMLARVHTEAEIAAVLAHEGAHVAAGHAYLENVHEMTSDIVSTVVAAGVAAELHVGCQAGSPADFRRECVDPLTFGIPQRSILGYKRELETEADRTASDRLQATGYEPLALANLFARLGREYEMRGLEKVNVMHSDHPGLEARERTLRQLAAGAQGGESREAEYHAATLAARREALAGLVSLKDGPLLLALLEEPDAPNEFAELGHYALGEGYRLRGQAGDDDRALSEYSRAIELRADFAPPYNARGRLLERRGERTAALADLERYVQLTEDKGEIAFARQRIARLRKESTP
jgi:beta-barrel assembly-enhancing protease